MMSAGNQRLKHRLHTNISMTASDYNTDGKNYARNVSDSLKTRFSLLTYVYLSIERSDLIQKYIPANSAQISTKLPNMQRKSPINTTISTADVEKYC